MIYQKDGVARLFKKQDDSISNYQDKQFRKWLMLCAGSGITPVYQIVRWAERNQQDLTGFVIIYANKSFDDILLYEQLRELEQKGVGLYLVVESNDRSMKIYEGYLTQQVLMEVIQQTYGLVQIQDTIACVCGPQMFNRSQLKSLRTIGFSYQNIYKF